MTDKKEDKQIDSKVDKKDEKKEEEKKKPTDKFFGKFSQQPYLHHIFIWPNLFIRVEKELGSIGEGIEG